MATKTKWTYTTNTIKTQLKVFDAFQLNVYGLKIETSMRNKREKNKNWKIELNSTSNIDKNKIN